MSKFFQASDSESESSVSDAEIAPQRPVVSRTFAFSDDEEETKRVVRSAKDKRYEEMRNVIRQLKNHKKIKDMAKTLTDFESLTKCYDKARKVIEKEGIPKFFIGTISDLEDFINECWEDRDGRKSMSKNNAKGLTTLRQKLRKHNRDFEKEIANYRQNPDDGGDDDDESKEEDSDESDDDEDMIPGSGFLKAKPAAKVDTEESKSKFLKDEDDDSDSEFWGSSSSDEETTTDEEEYQANPAARFLKQVGGDSKKHEKKKKEKKVMIREDDEYPSDTEKDEWQTVKQGSSTLMEKPKMFSKDTEINHLAVIKKLEEILAARGKKATDRTEQLDLLKELLTISDANNLGPAMHIKIFFHIISAIYDYNPNIATCMRAEMWAKCLENIQSALTMLVEHPDITVSQNIAEESESVETSPFRVRGCILVAMERMDEEFTKMLQACDAHSTEYVDRLKDEQKVCSLLEDLMRYLEERASTEEKCRIYLCYVEHVYYKFDRKYFDYKDGITEKPEGETSEQLMARLCKFIYANDTTDRLRTRAILCHIYHHALHDRWFQARDLMLMSHLQDTCHHSDVPTQILYNRTMVQLGLCAFREGMIKDAHNALVDIQSGGRAKELLAQGLLLQRQHERTPEQEKIEKRRQMPYHKHINLELLECVYLVSAMLMEIPYMAAHEFDARRRMISKNFHHVMRMSERQTLTGPPESMRENVVAASRAMKTGNWRACRDFIVNEKMNSKVWDLFHNKDRVRDMIATKIQEESLRTYLFTYSSVYDSLSLVTLSQMFELEIAVTHSIISKMIINEELMASLDEPTQTVVMHRTEPSRLQALALQLSEKVSSLVDNNEKIMDMKQGNFYPYQKGGQQDGYNRNQDNRNWGNRNQQNQNWGRRQNRQQKSYY